MKTIILLFLPLYLFSQKCPPQGYNKKKEIITADLLKNRSWCPSKDKAKGYSFELLSKDAIKDTGFIFIDAYITSAKISGI